MGRPIEKILKDVEEKREQGTLTAAETIAFASEVDVIAEKAKIFSMYCAKELSEIDNSEGDIWTAYSDHMLLKFKPLVVTILSRKTQDMEKVNFQSALKAIEDFITKINQDSKPVGGSSEVQNELSVDSTTKYMLASVVCAVAGMSEEQRYKHFESHFRGHTESDKLETLNGEEIGMLISMFGDLSIKKKVVAPWIKKQIRINRDANPLSTEILEKLKFIKGSENKAAVVLVAVEAIPASDVSKKRDVSLELIQNMEAPSITIDLVIGLARSVFRDGAAVQEILKSGLSKMESLTDTDLEKLMTDSVLTNGLNNFAKIAVHSVVEGIFSSCLDGLVEAQNELAKHKTIMKDAALQLINDLQATESVTEQALEDAVKNAVPEKVRDQVTFEGDAKTALNDATRMLNKSREYAKSVGGGI